MCRRTLARQAAHAVRRRIGWKSGRRLERTAPGCDASALRACPTRRLTGAAESLLLDLLLTWCRDRQLIKARGRQRTDSTHILAAGRALNRGEVVGERGGMRRIRLLSWFPSGCAR